MASAVDGAHVGVALAGGRSFRGRGVDPLQVFRAEAELESGGVFLQVVAALGARDGDDVGTPGEEPGQGQLAGCGVLLTGDLLDAVDEPEVLLEVLALEAGRVAAVIVGGQVLEAAEAAGE